MAGACSEYLCPTLECVPTPAACGCPSSSDVKCPIGDRADGFFVCARSCEAVNKAAKLK